MLTDTLLCPAELPGRCERGFRHWHQCDFDDTHDGDHECGCGETWREDDE